MNDNVGRFSRRSKNSDSGMEKNENVGQMEWSDYKGTEIFRRLYEGKAFFHSMIPSVFQFLLGLIEFAVEPTGSYTVINRINIFGRFGSRKRLIE